MDSFAVASKLEVALQGNPSPTSSLRPLTLFALLARQTGTLTGCPVNAQRNDAMAHEDLFIVFPTA